MKSKKAAGREETDAVQSVLQKGSAQNHAVIREDEEGSKAAFCREGVGEKKSLCRNQLMKMELYRSPSSKTEHSPA